MWLLVLLVAVSVVVTVVARRRHTDEHDSVDAQQRRIEALRTAVSQHDDPSDSGSVLTAPRTRRDRRSGRTMLGHALVALAVIVAGVAIYAIAAGWDSTPRADDEGGAASEPSPSSSTTTSTSSTTTTTLAVVPTVQTTPDGTTTVSVPNGPYKVHIAAHDPCWTQAERADGTVVETQTLQAGEAIDLDETGALTIRFGNPAAVELSVDGTVLTLPPSTGDALEVALVPAT